MSQLRWLGVLFAGCSLGLSAQQTAPTADSGQSGVPASPHTLVPRSHEERESIYRSEHRITLSVQVTDAKGAPVTSLTKEDFTLLENDQPGNIASLQSVDSSLGHSPVHIVLMVDAVNNPASNIADVRKGLEKFLRQDQVRLPHPTSIGLLTDAGVRVGQSSQDGNALIGDLRSITKDIHTLSCKEGADASAQEGLGGPQSSVTPEGTDTIRTEDLLNGLGKCQNRNFQLSISSLNRLAKKIADEPGRVILVWVGPGWPLLTGPAFRTNTVLMRRKFYDYLTDLSNSLREAQITLDMVASAEMLSRVGVHKDDYLAFKKRTPTGEEADAGDLALPVLANQTGGRVLDGSRDIAGDVAACVADADAYYVLSYDSAPPATVEYRSIAVKINKPELAVRTNAGYYAQP